MASRLARVGRTVALGALALIAAQPASASNAAKLTAYGPRAAGRGGVDYAFADDATAGATNPAGLAFIGNRVDNGWGIFDAAATFKNGLGTATNVPHLIVPVPAYVFGVSFDPEAPWRTAEVFDFGNWGLRNPPPATTTPPPANPIPQRPPNDGGAKDPPDVYFDDKSAVAKAPTSSSEEREPSDEELYGGKFRIGFGIFPVTGGFFRQKSLASPVFPEGVEYRGGAQMLAVAPTFAMRVTKNFSFGITPEFLYSTFKIKGPISQPVTRALTPDFQLATSILTVDPNILTYSNSKDLTTFGFSGRVGLMFNTEIFSLGVIYQERTFLQDELGSVKIDASRAVDRLTQGNPNQLQLVNTGVNPSLGFRAEYDLRVKVQFPRYAGIGVAFRPIPRISFGVDYTFIQWSELYKNFEARLTNGSNPNLDIIAGKAISVSVPLNYRDQHVIAVGASFMVYRGDDIVPGVPEWALVWRAGYNFAENPQPRSTMLPNFPTFYKHHVSTGFSILWGPHWDLTFAFEHAFKETIHTSFHAADPDLSNDQQTTQLTSYYVGFGCNF